MQKRIKPKDKAQVADDFKDVFRTEERHDNKILWLGYVAMTKTAYERKVPKLNYETEKLQWEE